MAAVAASYYFVTTEKSYSARMIFARLEDVLQGTEVRHAHLFMTDTLHISRSYL